ncbi:MAG: hypothetical protein IT385_26345 [Deltaproteobacteria bacterium]|nr:hypothetical protein [Deltaproteobacteria bacterium]
MRAPVLLIASLSALVACGDSGSTSDLGADAPADAEVDIPDDDASAETAETAEVDVAPEVVDTTSPGSFRWDPAAVAPADFYAYPWPSDLRTLASGAPDLAAFPTDKSLVDILGLAIDAVEAGAPGFSPLSSAYFGLGVDLDPASLEGRVLLVDVTRGERLRATVEWNAAGGGYWPARTLAVHPDYQVPPRAGSRLAAIVTTGVTTADGAPLEAPAIVKNLDLAAGPEAESLRRLLPALADLGLTRDDLIAWTTWPTSDPMAELRALAAWVAREPAPATSGLALVERKTTYDRYQGELTIVEAFSGTPPYTEPFGAGLIAVLPSGAPATPKSVTIPFTLTVPRTSMPDGGFPLVLYGHGLGEDHTGFLRTAAAPLAARGVAVIGLDPPLQGARNTTTTSDRELVIALSVGNIVGGREILRQGVLDALQLARVVAAPGFVVPADVAPDGAELRFDAARLGWFGHSEGAQIGALLLPLAPAIGPAVFSEGGGGAAITMLVLKLPEIDVGAAVSRLLGVDQGVERWALGHPLVTAVIQPLLDPADPLHLARHIFREPLSSGDTPGVAHDLVMLEGFLDALTPPVSIEALASAAGLPIAEPVARAIDGLDAQQIGSVTLPATGNLPPATEGARRPAGALLQLPEEDHYIIYFNAPVRNQLMDFLASALAGAATLAPAEAPPVER